MNGLLLEKLWGFSEIFLDLWNICCHCGLLYAPWTAKYKAFICCKCHWIFFLRLCSVKQGSSVRQISPHPRFCCCCWYDVLNVYSFIVPSFFSFIQIMSKQRQDLLSWSLQELRVFCTGLSALSLMQISQNLSQNLSNSEITGAKQDSGTCIQAPIRHLPPHHVLYPPSPSGKYPVARSEMERGLHFCNPCNFWL